MGQHVGDGGPTMLKKATKCATIINFEISFLSYHNIIMQIWQPWASPYSLCVCAIMIRRWKISNELKVFKRSWNLMYIINVFLLSCVELHN